MPRKNKKARKLERPKPLRKIRLIHFPKQDRNDIRPGRVVCIAEYGEGAGKWNGAQSAERN